MNILALDTSTEACSAALLRADGELFAEFAIEPRAHNHRLPEMMAAVLAAGGIEREALTHCAFANGPGAFTGIRIAAAQAQGIGIGLGIPLVPVSTLAVLAQAALERLPGERVLAALDARMAEVYWAIYRRDRQGMARLQGGEGLAPAADIRIPAGLDIGAGHGWRCGLDAPPGCEVRADLLPDAGALARLARAAIDGGGAVAAPAATLNYLRNRVAEKSRP